MSLARFLTELFDQGHVHMAAGPEEPTADNRQQALEVLVEQERMLAIDFPGTPPALDLPAATWAGKQFFTACRFVLFREATDAEVRTALAEPCPAGDTAALHYSVDLVWRFLPDLDRLTASFAPHDCLREIIRAWGAARPLSSVGMKAIDSHGEHELLEHAGLRCLYVDRIIARQDSTRLRHPQVRDYVMAALGRERAASQAWCRTPVAAQIATGTNA